MEYAISLRERRSDRDVRRKAAVQVQKVQRGRSARLHLAGKRRRKPRVIMLTINQFFEGRLTVEIDPLRPGDDDEEAEAERAAAAERAAGHAKQTAAAAAEAATAARASILRGNEASVSELLEAISPLSSSGSHAMWGVSGSGDGSGDGKAPKKQHQPLIAWLEGLRAVPCPGPMLEELRASRMTSMCRLRERSTEPKSIGNGDYFVALPGAYATPSSEKRRLLCRAWQIQAFRSFGAAWAASDKGPTLMTPTMQSFWKVEVKDEDSAQALYEKLLLSQALHGSRQRRSGGGSGGGSGDVGGGGGAPVADDEEADHAAAAALSGSESEAVAGSAAASTSASAAAAAKKLGVTTAPIVDSTLEIARARSRAAAAAEAAAVTAAEQQVANELRELLRRRGVVCHLVEVCAILSSAGSKFSVMRANRPLPVAVARALR